MPKRSTSIRQYLTIEGRSLRFKSLPLNIILTIITLGIYRLIIKFYPQVRIFLETKRCSIKKCSMILSTNEYNTKELISVKKFYFPFISPRLKRFVLNKEIRYFDSQYQRFFYDNSLHRFVLPPLDSSIFESSLECAMEKSYKKDNEHNMKIREAHRTILDKRKMSLRYTIDHNYKKFFFQNVEMCENYILYGENDTGAKEKSFFIILMLNLIHPLFLYNFAGIVLWWFIEYKTYAVIILFLTGYSLITDILSDAKRNKDIKDLSKIEKRVLTFKEGQWHEKNVKWLFPGDLFYIDTTKDFPCDARILKGEVIVDESFLTGETVPIFKSKDTINNIVYAGTKVLKSIGEHFSFHQKKEISKVKVKTIKKRTAKGNASKNTNADKITTENTDPIQNIENDGKAIAMVVSTGFDTSKGRLMKNILIPKPIGFVFYKESINFIFLTFLFSIVCILILICYFFGNNIKVSSSLSYPLDLLFCILSPALPTTIWIGSSIANKRLRKKKIICTESDKINIAGKVDLIIFDKTGTLTEEGLDIYCIDNIDNEFYELKEIDVNYIKTESEEQQESEEKNEIDYGDLYRQKEELEKSFNEHFENINNFESTTTDDSEKNNNSKGSYNEIKSNNDKSSVAEAQSLIEKNIEKVNKMNQINYNLIKEGLSTCHSLYIMDNELVGDPLDIKMFIFSESRLLIENNQRCVLMGNKTQIKGPTLKELKDDEDSLYYYKTEENNYLEGTKLNVMKVFDFDNKLRRMSVIISNDLMAENTRKYRVFVKGSPESIAAILNEIPEDFDDVVKDHALDGYRILALAYKDMDALTYQRDMIETELTFLCFIVFANKLKEETKPTLEELSQAKIKTMMATGDNILTAISVGRQAKMIDKFVPIIFPVVEDNSKSIFDAQWLCIGDEELTFDKVKLTLHKSEDRVSYSEFYVAIEGKEYELIRKENKEYFDFILKKGIIFARMNPDQKKILMEDLSNLGHSTLFCGDGANDCGALKSADIGISLAENESSLASSFTSTNKNISSVLIVLKEGRCALIGSFYRFLYIVLTCYIQFFCLYILCIKFLFLGDFQTIHSDLLIVLPIAYLMTQLKSSDKLHEKDVEHKLYTKSNIFHMVSYICISLFFVACSIIYCGVETHEKFSKKSLVGSFIFFISAFQMIIFGVIFAKGEPHRENVMKKKIFCSLISIIGLFTFFLMINAHFGFIGYLNEKYDFVCMCLNDLLVLCAFIIVNSIVIILFDKYI